MNPIEQHEISESGHRIVNPLSDDKLMLIGEVCRFEPGQRLLDLGSGKGEMLCRFAQRFGIGGVGVDLSVVFDSDARRRAAELGVTERVEFVRADAATYEPTEVFDVTSCIGATWIGGGLAGTIELLRGAVRKGGLVLVGEPYWIDPPPEEAYLSLGVGRDDFSSLQGTFDRFERAGVSLVEMVLADGDSWDRYEAEQWWAVADWLAAHPDAEEASEMRSFLDRSRRSHLAYGRRYLGWGVFLLRA